MSSALWSSLSFVLCGLYLTWPALRAQHQPGPAVASVEIDADRVEGQISPVLYGQFDEFMFEGVKRGLTAELIRDRSFDEAPNAIGLPRFWEREPDDRNDDPGLHFHWDDAVYYPTRHEFMSERTEHSLRVNLAEDDGQRRGIRQGGIPIRQGLLTMAICGSGPMCSRLASMLRWKRTGPAGKPTRLRRSMMFSEIGRNTTIKLAINEWNTSSPVPSQHSMESALYAVRLMNVFERSDIVAMSAVSDMVNG